MLLVTALVFALAGCDLSMTRQVRHEPRSSPTLWPDGPAVAASPAGTVAQDDPARAAALARPPEVSLALLRRGQERYGIYCTACHGASGDGDGVVVRRGFPRPPAYSDPRVMALTPAQIVDVIGYGYGLMYDFAERVAPADRWAIAAYVKALQRAREGPRT
jgi:mono/diheme cytochrome c family protein